jgi:hypothetical protein
MRYLTRGLLCLHLATAGLAAALPAAGVLVDVNVAATMAILALAPLLARGARLLGRTPGARAGTSHRWVVVELAALGLWALCFVDVSERHLRSSAPQQPPGYCCFCPTPFPKLPE